MNHVRALFSKRSGGEAWAAELRQLSSLKRGERKTTTSHVRKGVLRLVSAIPRRHNLCHSKPADPLASSLFPPFLCHDLQATDECREQEQQSFHGKSSSVGYSVQKVSHENIHTSNTIQTEKDLFMSLRIYMYIHICMDWFERQSKEEYMGRLKRKK